MNAQYTPGPWDLFPNATDKTITIANYTRHAPLVRKVAEISDDEDEQAMANARLIAAAPELLEALERLVDDYERVKRFAHDNGLQWVGSSQAPDWQARQVIAKARGQA